MKRDWLAKIRKEKGLSQEQLARKCGVKRAVIGKAEQGKDISVKVAKAIATVLCFEWYKIFDE